MCVLVEHTISGYVNLHARLSANPVPTNQFSGRHSGKELLIIESSISLLLANHCYNDLTSQL